MKTSPYFRVFRVLVISVCLTLVGCGKDFQFQPVDDQEIDLIFTPTLQLDPGTRAICDASGIDRLTVAVYDGGKEVLRSAYEWNEAKSNGVNLRLLSGPSYKVLFWADNHSNTAYKIESDGSVSVDYSDYLSGGFAAMEQMDAFVAVCDLSVNSSSASHSITLQRAMAQFNMASSTIAPVSGVHRAQVTLRGVPQKFNPLSATPTVSSLADLTFSGSPAKFRV